ncbi:glycosyltransferase family 2 protein [uncultured Pseudodesulfovibrio sp.]|uniref:glycosyltransferase family 2 protein n=1 Tax=uncultured Pseudodesulfovibrio sp. TaxID=2035858 RepID=UPI0029C7FF1E|nr:glycosyltransferase family 2 protein [uncultured Pseudodesulfovibrio sp.]
MTSRSLPFVTVVTPVYNEESFIADTLRQILGQDYPTDCFEIIVADGGSSDGTCDIVRSFAMENPCVRLMDNPGKRSSSGRNVGFREGKGDYFLVIDGHCHIPSKTLLSDMVRIFEETGAQCLGRPQRLDPPGLSRFQHAVAAARASRIGHGGDSLIYGDYEGFASPMSNGAAYTREVFETVGYVDETFDACEDVEFNYRVEKAGLRAYTSPRLLVQYYPRDSVGSLFRQMERYGLGRWELLMKHPETLSFNLLVPAVFVLAVITALLSLLLAGMGWISWWPVYVLVAPVLAYLALTASFSISLCGAEGVASVVRMIAIYGSIHGGLGWGFLKGCLNAARPR